MPSLTSKPNIRIEPSIKPDNTQDARNGSRLTTKPAINRRLLIAALMKPRKNSE
ncbi:hypothetical protein D3C86_1931990 [compost metagenome]